MKNPEEHILSRVAHALARLGVKSSSTLLAAVSGGVDSMSLAFILNELCKQGHFKKLALIHINHSLRGKESDKDEELVEKFAKKQVIPFDSFQVDTRSYAKLYRIGIEEAARHLRYQKFSELARKKKFQFIATAHTANDQVESVLMNIVRGSGLNGLQGIPEKRALSDSVQLVRPLLGIEKNALRAFAKENKIPFREDESNESLDFQRNRVRHLVLPQLEKAFKDRNIFSGFVKMAQNIASVAEYINSEVRSLREESIRELPSVFIHRTRIPFERKTLLAAPDFLRRELILQEASSLAGRVISLDQIQSILLESYLTYPSRKSYSLTKELLLSHDGKYLVIESIDAPPEHEHELAIGKKILTPVGYVSARKVRSWNKPEDANCAYFSFDAIADKKLHIRYWRHGDRIKPFGMKGKSRLVSDILNEAGIKSERLKYFVPLIVFKDEPEFILWIPGIRSAEYGRLSSESETALELKRSI